MNPGAFRSCRSANFTSWISPIHQQTSSLRAELLAHSPMLQAALRRSRAHRRVASIRSCIFKQRCHTRYRNAKLDVVLAQSDDHREAGNLFLAQAIRDRMRAQRISALVCRMSHCFDSPSDEAVPRLLRKISPHEPQHQVTTATSNSGDNATASLARNCLEFVDRFYESWLHLRH